jgi:hypothetical protein
MSTDTTMSVQVDVDGFHASRHGSLHSIGAVGLTTTDYVALKVTGVFKKRVEPAASWPLAQFTDRVNRSEGTALGPFMYFVTFFTPGEEETVSAAFRSPAARDDFALTASRAIAVAKGD